MLYSCDSTERKSRRKSKRRTNASNEWMNEWMRADIECEPDDTRLMCDHTHLIYLCMPITNERKNCSTKEWNGRFFHLFISFRWRFLSLTYAHTLSLSLPICTHSFRRISFFFFLPKCKSKCMGTWQMLFRHTCVESTVDVLTWRKMVFFISWNCKIALHTKQQQ